MDFASLPERLELRRVGRFVDSTRLAREPLLARAAVAGSVTALAALAGVRSGAVGARDRRVLGVASVLAPAVVWTWAVTSARAKITPVDRPADHAGNRLVPEGLRHDVEDSDELLEPADVSESSAGTAPN
ncbi:hypothetical protein SAMN05421678_12613 [Actinopolymorpha cephalotaxi]|uniref:Uncharacterized protein n=1 Tax=Actinopolymorpha cephalotaxi TaxID=504797 RepID=A0A1I3BS99_9ACTN|nr:hypothetical protein SAMN05421678_12613 [Actinopolymorpha cephalotaxi]